MHKEGYVVPTLPTACLHSGVQLHLHALPNATTSAQENPEGIKVALQSIVCAHVVPSRVIMCNCRCRIGWLVHDGNSPVRPASIEP